MAIRMMTDKATFLADPTNIEVVRDYHGHAQGIWHVQGCPHHNAANARAAGSVESWRESFERSDTVEALRTDCLRERYPLQRCRLVEPLYMKTTHQGLVLDLGEYNGRDDSDFYALVWDDAAGRPTKFEYASTRGWTYPNGATIDATPEVCAKYAAYCETIRAEAAARKAAEAAKAVADHRAWLVQLEAGRVKAEVLAKRKGEIVTVKIKGKFVTGTLFWVRESSSGKTVRIGVKDAQDKAHWASASALQ